MFELSVNEEIQVKAREDVKNAIKKHGGKLTYDSVADMTYLEQCVNETLRKYPGGATLQRIALSDYKLQNSDITIPKNTGVIIPVHAIHWDEELYPNPSKFDPERFTPEEIASRHPMAYIPFGEGPRICVGLRFGLVQTKIALAKVLMRYKFTIDRTKTTVPLKILPSSFVLTAAEKIILNISKIEINESNKTT
jgi:cytochrome P450 family 6